MKVLLALQISFSSKEYVGFSYVLPCMTYVAFTLESSPPKEENPIRWLAAKK